MRTFQIFALILLLGVLSPFAATAAVYLPDAFGVLYWSGFGGPGCEEFPTEAVVHYTVEWAPTGSELYAVLIDDLPHLGVGVEHTTTFTLPDFDGYDYRITCTAELDGQTFTADCEVVDVRIFVVCPGECGARTE